MEIKKLEIDQQVWDATFLILKQHQLILETNAKLLDRINCPPIMIDQTTHSERK